MSHIISVCLTDIQLLRIYTLTGYEPKLTMEKSSKQIIKRFTGQHEDYATWKGNFLANITLKDLDMILSDEYKIPKGREALTKYNRDIVKLYSYICLCVDQQTADIIELESNRNGVKAWRQIQDMYEQQNPL